MTVNEGGARWGRLFRVVRRFCRVFLPAHHVPRANAIPTPCVIVCRHKDMGGPIRTLLWLPPPLRPWVLDVFFDKARCYRQFLDFTLTKRLRWPRAIAVAVARLMSLCMPALLRSMRAIPVRRGSLRVTETFRETLEALRGGANVILFPDVDYVSTASEVGALYDGYVLLDTLYRRAVGRALAFFPVAVRGYGIVCGEPIYAAADESRAEVSARIRRALQALETPDAKRE